ncbi:hypothetical protein [Nocardioides sp. YIM 152315]|uniref:hypothetical protein n=1 Tax=Nocardioides sp. YIM 152315 TaxID=3031760 RepID=UPI0023DA42C5|nr:hypothetical protein [Nocardioides sp. YIM 152315]MDF1604418.1 hypothetical protein [Nocardioides sp. YIM 152315]
MTVRRTTSQPDEWSVLAGETRWVDYSADRDGNDLVVYAHTFRRLRDRLDQSHDVLLWKPSTTTVAHRYPGGEWDEVIRAEQEWPPVRPERVPRRPRHGALRRERRPRA